MAPRTVFMKTEAERMIAEGEKDAKHIR